VALNSERPEDADEPGPTCWDGGGCGGQGRGVGVCAGKLLSECKGQRASGIAQQEHNTVERHQPHRCSEEGGQVGQEARGDGAWAEEGGGHQMKDQLRLGGWVIGGWKWGVGV